MYCCCQCPHLLICCLNNHQFHLVQSTQPFKKIVLHITILSSTHLSKHIFCQIAGIIRFFRWYCGNKCLAWCHNSSVVFVCCSVSELLKLIERLALWCRKSLSSKQSYAYVYSLNYFTNTFKTNKVSFFKTYFPKVIDYHCNGWNPLFSDC